MSSQLIMFDVESGEKADLIVKSNSSDGSTNRYWLHSSRPLDASYWDRYSHNVTDTQWMLIFCERNCPLWQSRFPLNTNKATQLNCCGNDWLLYCIFIKLFNIKKNLIKADMWWQSWMDYVTGPWAETCRSPPLPPLIHRPLEKDPQI